MTKEELLIWLCDEFHDWIDGDDPVKTYAVGGCGDYVTVEFESGKKFDICVVDSP